MLKHYLTSALRHFARHKTTSIINVLCLSLGLTCFVVAFGMTRYYNHGDLYHEKADRTYVLTQRSEFVDSSTATLTAPWSGWGIAQYLKADYPELEIVARALFGAEMPVATGEKNVFAQVSFADPKFLDVFDLPFLAGDSRAALQTPHSAVIASELAKQIFGSTNVLGKTLILNNRETIHITGVMTTPRQPSHIALRSTGGIGSALGFNLLVSMDTRDAMLAATDSKGAMSPNRFFDTTAFTYLVFPKSGDITVERVRNDLARFSDLHVPKERGRATFGLRPVADIWEMFGDWLMKSEKTGVPNSVFTLFLGSLILLVSCLNYANLASAQAMTRLKETALRRVVGASNRQILLQSFIEAFLLVLAAACLSFTMLPAVVKGLEAALGINIGSVLYSITSFWIEAAAIVVVALLASTYPAWVAMRIRPAHALQSGRVPLTKRRFMNAMVVFQFFAASFLFIATSVMNSQNEKIRRAPPGVATDPIVSIDNNLSAIGIDGNVLQNELRRNPAIKSVSAMDVAAGRAMGPTFIVRASADASARNWILTAPKVDYDFFATMGIKLLAGRDFDRSIANDRAGELQASNVIIDRALAAEYGWANPQDAIGKPIFFPSGAVKGSPGLPVNVIGVVENEMLYPIALTGSTSTLYRLDINASSALVVRISKEDVADGIRAIDSVWNKLAPNVPLRRAFIDERFDAAYKTVSGMTAMFHFLAVFSIFIGVMGLIGIATHAMAQRRFEIGVRRTLGASVRQVLVMLLRDFSKPILIANLFAWPFAFVIAKAYSLSFVQKVPMTLLPFITSLLVGLLIAWLAVLKQATSAARMNPATVLRHE